MLRVRQICVQGLAGSLSSWTTLGMICSLSDPPLLGCEVPIVIAV